MNKIPTSEEFLLDFELGNTGKVDIEDAKEALIEFTKLHVQAALQAAAEQAKINYHTYFFNENKEKCLFEVDTYVDEQSILNAYPNNLIK